MDAGPRIVKREVKDSVFADLFGDPKYLLMLYQSLHPEDVGVTEADLANVTINNVLTNQLYNDLGFTVGERAIVLVEAQSRWSSNILPRCLLYLAETYKRWFDQTEQLLYSSRPARIPKPELYVVCPDPGAPHEGVLLSEAFFGGEVADVEMCVHPIVPNGGDDIAQQYLEFCRVVSAEVARVGLTREALEGAVAICLRRGILAEYLSAKQPEVVDMMTYLFDQESITKAYGRECEREGMAKGMARGIAEGLAEGQAKGEGLLGRLMAALLAGGKTDEAARAATDPAYRKELYEKYGIA